MTPVNKWITLLVNKSKFDINTNLFSELKMNYDRLKLAVSLITLHVFHEINAKKPPNILFIIADDLGWADVGFHGAKDVKTPVIDNLAHSGVILNNYYVQPISQGWCGM